MSTPTREAQTAIATIWPMSTQDEWGRKTYGAPYTLGCTYDFNNGTTYTDNTGVSFVPAAIVWYEQNSAIALPKEGDFIAKGDLTAFVDPTGADGSLPIKDVQVSDCSLFGEPDDIRVLA